MNWIAVLTLSIFLVLFGLTFYFLLFLGSKRREAWKKFGSQLGLLYIKIADKTLLSRYSFSLFTVDHPRIVRLENILNGKIQDKPAVLGDFDILNTSSSGTSRGTHKKTILIIENTELSVPDFTLRVELPQTQLKNSFVSALYEMAKKNMGKDINFESDPEFSEALYLNGYAESEIRTLFDKDLRRFFFNHLNTYPQLFCEVKHKMILVHNGLIDPSECQSLIDLAFSVITQLSSKK